MTAAEYLLKFIDDWNGKSGAIWDELYSDWCKNYGGKNQKEWDLARNDKQLLKYAEMRRK